MTATDAAVRWRPVLPDADARRALEVAHELARRCTDPELVRSANALCREQTNFPLSLHWDPLSVAQGDLGQALLADELRRADHSAGWGRTASGLADAAAIPLRRGHVPGMGTVSGSSGVAFVARRLGDTALTPHLPALDAAINRDALGTAAAIRGRRGLPVNAFDQISGLAGVLLCALPNDGRPAAAVAPFVVRALTALALEPGDPPAWFTPPEHLFDDEQRQHFPHGNLNLGLAHGIPGPLAALALAVRAGLGGPDAVAATRLLGEYVAEHAVDADGPGWPAMLPLEPGASGLAEASAPVGRDAWCYGTPGAARALYLAADALDRDDWRELAVSAMASVYRRPPGERGIDAPTFCHGVAGLLQVTLRFHHDTGLPLFADAAEELVAQIVGAVELDRIMGIANVEPGGVLVDQPGVLDGAAGVALVLVSAASEVEPTWDRMLALS